MYKSLNGPEYFPKSGNDPKNIIILLHGVGADGENLMGLAPYLTEIVDDPYIIAPNGRESYDAGVSVNGSYGYQWFSLWDRGYNNLKEGITGASKDVESFIQEITKRFNLKPENVILIGFSQGCMTAIHTALRMKDTVKAVIGFSGGTIVTAEEELDAEIKSKPSTCLIHGRDDNVVPFERTIVTEEALARNGVKVRTLLIDGLLHSIDHEGIKFMQNFISNLNN